MKRSNSKKQISFTDAQRVEYQPQTQGTDDVPQQQQQQQEVNFVNALLLSKLYEQQQQIMALHQNNDNILRVFDGNSQQVINNNYNTRAAINNSNDRFWFNENAENVRNQSKQLVNISALKHDHPLIASAVENINTRANNGLCGNDGILIASLPPTAQQTMTQTAQWFNDNTDNCIDEKKPICLPYGYCYDDEKVLTQSQIPANISDFKASFAPNEDEWMFDDNSLFSTANSYYNGISGYPYPCTDSINMENVFQVDKADLKTGPTLAQLNANLTGDVWDALDLDELLSSAQLNSKGISSSKSRFGSNNNNSSSNLMNTPTVTSMELEYDSKLQENIDYLTSLLQSSKNVANLPLTAPQVYPTKCLPSSSLTPNNNYTIQQQQEILTNSQNALQTIPSQQINDIDNNNANNQNNTMLSTLLGAQTVHQKSLSDEKSQQLPQTSTVISQNKMVSSIIEDNKALNRVRNNSMSTEYSVSSHDEGFASQPEDSDNEDDDMSSDDESFYGDYDASDLLGASTSDDANNKWSLNMGRSRKGGERRYFWQYNVQSKGPKGTRIASVEENGDPHVFKEISDPVFSPDCQIEGVKHSGKARRGDGNDLTPNPKKLLMIGLELKKLSKTINDLTPVAEVPVNSRSKSRKEKNKLASRACRLKKKAQHEANKIKLFGLQQEYKKIMSLLIEVKKLTRNLADSKISTELSATQTLEKLIKQKGPSVTVSGKTSEFVNHILDNVSAGISNGGLDKIV